MPSTLPGISRSVINLGTRLAAQPKLSLAEDGFIPSPLAQTPVAWRVCWVVSDERHDMLALERWISHTDDRRLFRIIVNRADCQEWRFTEVPQLATLPKALIPDDPMLRSLWARPDGHLLREVLEHNPDLLDAIIGS